MAPISGTCMYVEFSHHRALSYEQKILVTTNQMDNVRQAVFIYGEPLMFSLFQYQPCCREECVVLSDSILELILKSLASPESINEVEPMSNFQKEVHCQRSCLGLWGGGQSVLAFCVRQVVQVTQPCLHSVKNYISRQNSFERPLDSYLCKGSQKVFVSDIKSNFIHLRFTNRVSRQDIPNCVREKARIKGANISAD